MVITGGAGFIGTNFLKLMIAKYLFYEFVNIDKLSYSGNKENLKSLDGKENYTFIQEDITDYSAMNKIIKEKDIVVNFAAESHVDNSILEPKLFIENNVLGTHSVLESARKNKAKLFVQISTDEVYGSLDFTAEPSKETDMLKPSSPYSASKAASEMVCFGNMRTFKQPIIITRSSNNFGPYQFPEKVIPLFVANLLECKKVPIYGTGKNIRDWIYVQDNCDAIDFIIHNGKPMEVYNIGGGNEISNNQLTKLILQKMGFDNSCINYVEDRKGHDLRYSLDCSKLNKLGWKPRFNFDEALSKTIKWYKENKDWWKRLRDVLERRAS